MSTQPDKASRDDGNISEGWGMSAMVLNDIGKPPALQIPPDAAPGPGEVRLHVGARGACRTDLRVVDGGFHMA